MPTVKGYGVMGGFRQRNPVRFGGFRKRKGRQTVFGGRKRAPGRYLGLLRRRPLQGGMGRMSILPVNSYSFGHARHRRRRHYGRGFFDTLKDIGSKALGIARSVPIASTALGLMGKPHLAAGAKALGFARRRRTRHSGLRRGHARRPRYGVARRVKRGRGLLSSLLGMTGLARRRRKRGHARRRVKRGRGLLSSLLGMTGLARRRRVKRGGARRRRLLNVPRF